MPPSTLPNDLVRDYWRRVRDRLVHAHGLPQPDATAAMRVFRRSAGPAGETIYNTDPDVVADAIHIRQPDRLVITTSAPPAAAPDQVSGIRMGLFSAANRLLLARGGSGLELGAVLDRAGGGDTASALHLDVYRASEGRNPAGTLALVASQLRLMAERAGVAVPDQYGFRPETPADHVPDGRAITADARVLHHVAQDSPKNPERAAALAGDRDAARLLHEEAIAAMAGVLADAAAAGFRVTFELSPAAQFVRAGG